MQRKRVIAFTIAAVALASIAAGCGGNSSDKKSNEAYANSVCSAIGNWETQVKSLATGISGKPTQASIQAKATQFETDTKNLVNQIKAITPPDTSEGQAAKQQLDQLGTDLTNTVNAVKSGLSAVQANPSAATISAAIATLTPQLQSLVNTGKSAVSSLQQVGGSLADAFKNTDSCKSLTS
jgi:hypothetical protein